jgi:hypothetical protein
MLNATPSSGEPVPLIEGEWLTPEGKALIVSEVLKLIAISQQPLTLHEIVGSVSTRLALSRYEIVSPVIDAIGIFVCQGLADTDGWMTEPDGGPCFHFGGTFRPTVLLSELIWYDPRDARDDDHDIAC